MKRFLCMVLSMLLLATLFSGCGAEKETSKQTEAQTTAAQTTKAETTKAETTKEVKEVKLNFFHGKQEAQETFSEIIKRFTEKYPNIKVEQEIVTNDPSAVLKARIATGEIPDLLSCGIEVIDISKGGYLVELSGEPFMANIVEEAVKSSAFTDENGKTWSMPVDGSCIGVYYNKKLFADNGLAVPKTVSEFNKVCSAFKEKGIPAFALGFKDGWTIKMAIISAFSPAVYAGNINWDKDKRAEKESFEKSQGWKTAFELLKTIYTTGNTKTAFDTDYNAACAMFAKGEAAMMAQGLWALEPVRQVAPNADIGIMGMPVSENPADAKLHQFPDFSISVSGKSGNIDEAKKFLEFMTNKEIAELWCNKAKLFSAVKNISVNFDPVAADVNKLINENMICTQADRGWRSPFQPKFEGALPSFLLGERGLEDTLKYLDKEWDSAEMVAGQ